MNNSLKSLAAFTAFAALALGASAQPAPKVLVVDMSKLFATHWKTAEHQAKLQSDQQKAQEEIEKMNKEGNALVEEYKSLGEQANNPALSADGKKKAQEEAQKKLEGIQGKQRAIQEFVENARNSMGQRDQNFRGMMVEDITKVASEIAKKKGANMLFDKSALLYFDGNFEVTDDVVKELAKDRPANAAVPAAPAAAPASATPAISVPGISPKK
ncbi:MAG: OmpH family outer membrane protein [Opitutaceae bacterium]|nr:OmpH family outer membrane protein [Opitutaceae bacterium]